MHSGTDLLGAEECAPKRTQTTGGRNAAGQFDGIRSGHRSLDDGHLDPEQMEETAIGPVAHTVMITMTASTGPIDNSIYSTGRFAVFDATPPELTITG